MKKIKLLNICLIAIMLFNIFSATATAQTDNELPDLYKAYSGDNDIVEVEPMSPTPKIMGVMHYINSYNCYKVTRKLYDFCRISIFADAEINMDLSELTDKMGYSPDMFSISSEYSRDFERQFVEITFYTQDYNIKSDVSGKLYDLLKAEYKIEYAYIRTYNELESKAQALVWDSFFTTDEFGHKVTSEEQLSKKQVIKLRETITDNNFADVAEVNDDGKIIINEKCSDVEKLRFALWLKEEYGYYVKIADNIDKFIFNPPARETEVIHYTELSGDVDNDNYVTQSDAKALQEYLLSGIYTEYNFPYNCFNVKNADLTEDGVIDIFDLVLLRKKLIDSE